MPAISKFSQTRKKFHTSLLKTLLKVDKKGVVSNADTGSRTSKRITAGLAERLGKVATGPKLKGQESGRLFEIECEKFLDESFLAVRHLRPGIWQIRRAEVQIAGFEQYSHLGSSLI